jgi:hypothetical protein
MLAKRTIGFSDQSSELIADITVLFNVPEISCGQLKS